MEQNLFPHEKPRDIQLEFMARLRSALEKKESLIIQAPTGLGKTAAAISPALDFALKEKKKVFFLTSRHTQHLIAIETLKKIREKHEVSFISADFIGKRHMCTLPGVGAVASSSFHEFCKNQRDNHLCEKYETTFKGANLTPEGELSLERTRKRSPLSIDESIQICSELGTCPYEIQLKLAKEASIIICDYYYIFNHKIRESLFSKLKIKLEDAVIIIDEAHNIPDRARNLLTTHLSNFQLRRAIQEAKKIERADIVEHLAKLNDVLNDLAGNMANKEEKKVSKDDFLTKVQKQTDYLGMVDDLIIAGEVVRKSEEASFIASVAEFLDGWKGPDTGYARFVGRKETRKELITQLSYRCLDPSIITKEIIENSHSTIMMSGTLNPTAMYKEMLGFPASTKELNFASPFPKENRLSMIVPLTTTKYSARNDKQFHEIAHICAEMTNAVPGNCAIFFPSYYLRDEVQKAFNMLCNKTVLSEQAQQDADEKKELLENFKRFKKSGAVLLAVISGSFSEGIDLPGDYLKCVIIVGLPLQQPTLETKELIAYYDLKYGKGWEYGYVAPAFTKCMQGAGRCIRNETDKGVIVFLDERFNWPSYRQYFPPEYPLEITKDPVSGIKEFFSK